VVKLLVKLLAKKSEGWLHELMMIPRERKNDSSA